MTVGTYIEGMDDRLAEMAFLMEDLDEPTQAGVRRVINWLCTRDETAHEVLKAFNRRELTFDELLEQIPPTIAA